MLHDGEVFTLHLYEAGDLVAAHVSSHAYFDEPERPLDAALLPAVRRFAGDGLDLSDAALLAALTPPGPIDVDGWLAFRRVAGLLD